MSDEVKRRPVLERLERRLPLSPYLIAAPLQTTFTPLPVNAASPNVAIGTVAIAPQAAANYPSTAPLYSVSLLTPASQFGGDIVRIEAAPGGAFGQGIYAISRGAGENPGAVNRPGVIYRIDPANGKASVFFDLNTVVNQLDPSSAGGAANSVGTASGLVDWYDLAFDPEGDFDSLPSLFVASVDRSDPKKNVIYRVGPDGSFLGGFAQFSSGQSGVRFNINPTSILIPPPEDQAFLRGLISGSGSSSSGVPFAALSFDANAYAPGQNIASGISLPVGVSQTTLKLGPQVALTASNADYASRVYSAFTDFGSPAGPGIVAQPGLSGVQGIRNGELLIAAQTTTTLDQAAVAATPFRRFEDLSFDEFGYFSLGLPGSTTISVGPLAYAGSLFVTDLGTGLEVQGTPRAPLNSTPIEVPVQGPGTISLTTDAAGNVVPVITGGNTTGGSNVGGRVLRITPAGVVTTFAAGFHTASAEDSTSFLDSELSLSFSAAGTRLYVSDDDGIWLFRAASDASDPVIPTPFVPVLGTPTPTVPSTPTTTFLPSPVSTPVVTLTPTFVGVTHPTAGKTSKRSAGDFRLDFGIPLDPVAAQDTAHYLVVRRGAGRRPVPRHVSVLSATYDAGARSVTLTLGKHAAKKRLSLTATGLLDAGGHPVATIFTRL